MKWAAMKKGIYSVAPLRELLSAANRRYLEFISALDDPTAGIRHLNKISKTIVEEGRFYKGFNPDPTKISKSYAILRLPVLARQTGGQVGLPRK